MTLLQQYKTTTEVSLGTDPIGARLTYMQLVALLNLDGLNEYIRKLLGCGGTDPWLAQHSGAIARLGPLIGDVAPLL